MVAEISELPAFQTDAQHSVSGLSSGAFMAVQLHVAHSASFIGAGIIAGGPYRAAESFKAAPTKPTSCILNSLYVAMTPLTQSTAPNVERLLELTHQTANIDDTHNLGRQRLYVFSGRCDEVVNPYAVRSTVAYYEALGLLRSQIEFVSGLDAGHAILTNNPEDSPLGSNQPPYINNGGFFQSHDILDHIYGHRNPPVERPTGRMIRFRQERYTKEDARRSSLAEFGYAYIPEQVEQTGHAVGVHIVLHGCKQGYDYVEYVNGREDTLNRAPYGGRYIRSTGYIEWAEANGLIVLFPQVQAFDDNELQNPEGCWDWWGYTSEDYDNPDYYSRDAIQIKAIHAMLTQLSAGRKAVS